MTGSDIFGDLLIPSGCGTPSDTHSCCLRGHAKRSINPSLQALSLESGQSEAPRINASSAQKFKPFVRAAASRGGQCKEHFKLTFLPVMSKFYKVAGN